LVGALPQLVYMTLVTGSPLTNSYSVFKNFGRIEGFTHLTNPRILEFLFSRGNGLFVLAPITFVAFVGFLALARRDRLLTGVMLLTLVLYVYLCSSWWTVTFGFSFIARPMVDVMALLVVPLAVGIADAKERFIRHRRPVVMAFLAATVIAIAFNAILMVDYWHLVG
jgi:putative effector of murein hydrolase LrgA (UPF0299 family)